MKDLKRVSTYLIRVGGNIGDKKLCEQVKDIKRVSTYLLRVGTLGIKNSVNQSKI